MYRLFFLILDMQINIRPATIQDAPAILDIVNHNILHSTALYDYTPKDIVFMKDWLREKAENNWPVIVATQGDNVVGYGTYGTFRFKEGYKYTVEHSVYVSHEHTGKGIGKLLLAELIRLVKKRRLSHHDRRHRCRK